TNSLPSASITITNPSGARAATFSLTPARAWAGCRSKARASKRYHMGDSDAGAAPANFGPVLVIFNHKSITSQNFRLRHQAPHDDVRSNVGFWGEAANICSLLGPGGPVLYSSRSSSPSLRFLASSLPALRF